MQRSVKIVYLILQFKKRATNEERAKRNDSVCENDSEFHNITGRETERNRGEGPKKEDVFL